MEDVFGFVVFHGGFPVSEGVEGYFVDSWVLEFVGCSFLDKRVFTLHNCLPKLAILVAFLEEKNAVAKKRILFCAYDHDENS
jgi:hypothetical protein